MSVDVLNRGALLHAVRVPDRDGAVRDVVLGFDRLEDYCDDHPSLGLTVGRFANRIENATFALDGNLYEVSANEGVHHLHGGTCGFGEQFWTPGYVTDSSVTFSLRSPDGDEGYPGDLDVAVTYTVHGNALIIDYAAAASKPTPVNLTNHAYFNLSGGKRGDILNHQVRIDAARRVELDESLIPTGRIVDVAGTGYDFQSMKSVEQGLRDLDHDQGFDLCYALDGSGESLPKIAEVFEPDSGIVMDVYTSEPGVQFYTSNFMDGSLKGKGGAAYDRYCGLCLETQKFPDSPNRPDFPDCILRPDQLFRSRTIYAFSVRP